LALSLLFVTGKQKEEREREKERKKEKERKRVPHFWPVLPEVGILSTQFEYTIKSGPLAAAAGACHPERGLAVAPRARPTAVEGPRFIPVQPLARQGVSATRRTARKASRVNPLAQPTKQKRKA
jgi:hypothetical protein